MEFLDANVFVRFLTRDDPDKAERCWQLFRRARERKVKLVTSEAIIAEVVYVLSSTALYQHSRQEIRAMLWPILSLAALRVPHRKSILRALDLYASINFDFADALSVAHMERMKVATIISYDRDFDRAPGLQRKEP